MVLKFNKKPAEDTAPETSVEAPKKLLKAVKGKALVAQVSAPTEPIGLDAGTLALIEKMINKRGSLMQEEEALKVRLKEIADQKAEMEELLRKHPALLELDPEETLPLETEDYVAIIGKMGSARSVTAEGKDKLMEFLGAEKFVTLAKFGITDLDNYLTLTQREQVMTSEPTKRTIVIKPRKA